MHNQISLILGGSGFIGQHLINKLESNYLNLDIVQTENNYQYCDVKNSIDLKVENPLGILYNLAAIHTTPGHEYQEYFETNIKGAENMQVTRYGAGGFYDWHRDGRGDHLSIYNIFYGKILFMCDSLMSLNVILKCSSDVKVSQWYLFQRKN